MAAKETALSTGQLASLWYARRRPIYTYGNTARLHCGGAELFATMLHAIENARHEIYLATYIFNTDSQAQSIATALSAAAVRGVQVRIVVDGFGSLNTIPTLKQWWQGYAVAWVVFRPLDRWWAWLQPEHLRRLHLKLCVVDESIAFVGGINIIDDYVDQHHGILNAPRLDFAVQVTGPVVAPIVQTLKAVWNRAAWGADWREEIMRVLQGPHPWAFAKALVRQMRLSMPGSRPMTPEESFSGVGKIAFVWRDNLRQRHTIERTLRQAFAQAQHAIDVVCPYFFPGRGLTHLLRKAAQRGVRVRLLMQGQYDYAIAQWAAGAVYTELLASGVQIFEYTPAFLHAKVVCIDDNWATVGSANIDPLSLWVNYEANLIVGDAAFIHQLQASIEAAFSASSPIKQSQALNGWRRRWLHRGIAVLARIYLRLSGNRSQDMDY